MARIEAMKDKNEAETELKKFAQENGYKLDLKRLELEFEQTRLDHQRQMRKLDYEREHQKDLTDIERAKQQAYDRREADKIYKDHERRMKELSMEDSRRKREDDR